MKLSDGHYKMCNIARENLDHILIKCCHNSDVWGGGGWGGGGVGVGVGGGGGGWVDQIVYFLGERLRDRL